MNFSKDLNNCCEGIIYQREAEPRHNFCTDEVIGHYEYHFKVDTAQSSIKQLIEDLQLLVKAFETEGIK